MSIFVRALIIGLMLTLNMSSVSFASESTLGTVKNYGTGLHKKGGAYASIVADKVLKKGAYISFDLKDGKFSYIMIHARYNGGIWKSVMKVTKLNQKVPTDSILQKVKQLKRGNPTNIIFSINGEHERYLKMPAEAIVMISDGKAANKPPQTNGSMLGTIKNYGTGQHKKGGAYASIVADKVLKKGAYISFDLKDGKFSYIMIHARYNGGIWKSVMKVTKLNQKVPTDSILQKVKQLKRGNPTNIIFSINGEHERYLKMPAEAVVMISDGKAANKPPQTNGSMLGTIKNYGTGQHKKGGAYASIVADKVLKKGAYISFDLKDGKFSYIMIHARYNGGIWKSVMKVTKPNQKVSTDSILQKVKQLKRGNPTHIIFSINGEHERYLKMPAEAIVMISDGKAAKLPVNEPKKLGCFKDNQGRDLDGFSFVGIMNAKICSETCRSKGFKYAGTQYSEQCFCGNSYGKYGKADNCDMPCKGHEGEICGGTWANTIYKVE